MKSKNLSNKILRLIKSKGFKNIELDPVLETKYILQRSGENFRKYLFSFYNSDAKELSLTPDLSISSLLRYAQKSTNNKEKVFYTGSAFRKSYNKKNVVVKQIGMEIFSSEDENKDDKEILDTSIKIIKKYGFKKATVKIGNFKLFELLIKKLSIPQRWKFRLLKFYWNEKYFSELLKRLQSNSDIDPIVVAGDKKTYLKMKKENSPIEEITNGNINEIREIIITLDTQKHSSNKHLMDDITRILLDNEGNIPVSIVVKNNSEKIKLNLPFANVNTSKSFEEKLDSIVGLQNVFYKH